MKTHLKLGTRKSLLARAQSAWVARELIRTHEERGLKLTVELVGVETQGDIKLDKPLSQMEGKDFFTAELDHALLKNEVDFTVHSMKDLSLDRPPQFTLAATPRRELQHDVIIFHESVLDRLSHGQTIRIGTSSPRRLTLIPEFLERALPIVADNKKPIFQFREIRGNINTRMLRIHEAEGSERKLDGVVLAFAGLERLAQDEAASLELKKLLEHTRLMILPLRENPTAPAQGAIAIEARTDQPETVKLIRALHDSETTEGVNQERTILREWGGGCHQQLGASWVNSQLYIRGQKPNGEKVSEVRGATSSSLPSNYLKVETASIFDFTPVEPSRDQIAIFENSTYVFLAHARAFEFLPLSLEAKLLQNKKQVWVSGTNSWFKLAKLGIWVSGCTEGMGFKTIELLTHKKLFNVQEPKMMNASWAFLTSAESVAMSPKYKFKIGLIPTYAHSFKSVPRAVTEATHLYWSSGLAFATVLESFDGADEREKFLRKSHACGPGRTLTVLKNYGVTPALILANAQEAQ